MSNFVLLLQFNPMVPLRLGVPADAVALFRLAPAGSACGVLVRLR
jgi:hypothetical protein